MSRRFRSVPTLALAYGIAALASFLLNVCAGRGAGAAALGDFALAVATSRIFYAGTDLGLAAHMTRTLSRDTSRSAHLLALFLGFRVCLVPIAVIVCTVSGSLFGRANLTMFALVAVAQGVVTVQNLYESLVLAHEKQRVVAALTTASALSISAGALLWLALSSNLTLFALAYAVSSLCGVSVWMVWAARRLHVPPRMARPDRTVQAEIARSWPIGISVLLGIAALRAPLLVLAGFVHREQVGAFSAVDMFVTASAILQAAVSSATFPSLAASYGTDPARFRRLFVMSNVALGLLGVAIAVFLAFAGAPLIAYVFPGKDFTQVGELMPIVAWSTPALLLVHHNVYMFAAANKEDANLRVMGLWFVIITVLQLAIVPSHGVVGAAWALLLARTIGLCLLAVAVVMGGTHRGGKAGA